MICIPRWWKHTVPLKCKLPLSRETRLVSLYTRLVSREKLSKNCKYHYKVSHPAEVRNRSAHRSVDLSREVRVNKGYHNENPLLLLYLNSL